MVGRASVSDIFLWPMRKELDWMFQKYGRFRAPISALVIVLQAVFIDLGEWKTLYGVGPVFLVFMPVLLISIELIFRCVLTIIYYRQAK